MKTGDKYNWIGQPERLVFIGKNGMWNQFALIETPEIVWCEVLDHELDMLEESKDENK